MMGRPNGGCDSSFISSCSRSNGTPVRCDSSNLLLPIRSLRGFDSTLPLPTDGFELRIAEPDGTELGERFNDSSDLAKRPHALIDEIKDAGRDGPHDRNL